MNKFSFDDVIVAQAELVTIRCPNCGATRTRVFSDPSNREIDWECPDCLEYYTEYGRCGVERHALIVDDEVVLQTGGRVPLMDIIHELQEKWSGDSA